MFGITDSLKTFLKYAAIKFQQVFTQITLIFYLVVDLQRKYLEHVDPRIYYETWQRCSWVKGHDVRRNRTIPFLNDVRHSQQASFAKYIVRQSRHERENAQNISVYSQKYHLNCVSVRK